VKDQQQNLMHVSMSQMWQAATIFSCGTLPQLGIISREFMNGLSEKTTYTHRLHPIVTSKC
jgi:hypothetical protein